MIKHLNTVWLVVVAVILGMSVIYPQWLTRESIAQLLNQLGSMALVVYVLMSLTRSVLLIPCTPFVLAGAISFPQGPFLVFAISLAGVVVGAVLVYSSPSFGNYDRLLEEKYPEKIANLKTKMQHKNAFWFVVGWAFFPLSTHRCRLLRGGGCQDAAEENADSIITGRITISGRVRFSRCRNWRVA